MISRELDIVGFGASVFVDEEFARCELAHPQPGLNSRIIASIAAGRPVTLSDGQLRRANTEGRLHLIILFANWNRDLLTETDVAEVQMKLAFSFQQLHDGFRVHLMLTELVTDDETAYADSMPAWRVLTRFEEYFCAHPDARWNHDRGLATVTRESAFAEPGHVAMGLFHHRKPTLALNYTDQDLLELALKCVDDEEVAAELNLTLPAVKRRWENIFARVGQTRPEMVGADDGPGRGRQKRYRILAYIREHPEELRPFELRGDRDACRATPARRSSRI